MPTKTKTVKKTTAKSTRAKPFGYDVLAHRKPNGRTRKVTPKTYKTSRKDILESPQEAVDREANLAELVTSSCEFVRVRSRTCVAIAADRYPDRETVRSTLQTAMNTTVMDLAATEVVVVGVSHTNKQGVSIVWANTLVFNPLEMRVTGDTATIKRAYDLTAPVRFNTASEALSHGVGVHFVLGQRRFRIMHKAMAQRLIKLRNMPGVSVPITLAQDVSVFVECGDGPPAEWKAVGDAVDADAAVVKVLERYRQDPDFTC
jgi:hypothetical protein